MITALAGGVGAARLLRGLVRVVPPAEVTAVVNTGDDTVLHGLLICPDLDTVTYTLAGLNDDERGWGLAGETWTVMEALERLGGESLVPSRATGTWPPTSTGPSDWPTGPPCPQVTAEITAAVGIGARLLPMSDDPVRTRLTLVGGPEIAFQEYFVRRQHAVAVASVRFDGADRCRARPRRPRRPGRRPTSSSSAPRTPSSPSVPSWPFPASPTPCADVDPGWWPSPPSWPAPPSKVRPTA